MNTVCDRCFAEIINTDEHGIGACPYEPRPAGFGVAGDDIPGGVVIQHGAGLAGRKFYSKTEIKRAANEHGWVRTGDTPGRPYKVSWSGRQKSQGGLPIKEQ